MLNLTKTTALTHNDLTTAIVPNPITVSPEVTVREAIALMSGSRLHCEVNSTSRAESGQMKLATHTSCVVVVESGRVVGIFTERDVVRLCANQQLSDEMPISQVMTTSVITLRKSTFTEILPVVNLLQHHQIRHLPIVDEQDCLVGLVTYETLRQVLQPTDLLRLRLVREVMTQDVITADPADSLLTVAQSMANNCISSVVLVQQEHPKDLPIPLGIITERDLIRCQVLGLDFECYPVAQVMSSPVITVPEAETLLMVQHLMERYLVRRVVVTGAAGELLGIVTQTNVLQALSPLELYKLSEVLENKIKQLETEKIELLKHRNLELEAQVISRTANLQKQLQREQVVADLATQIRSSLSLQTILETAVEQIRQVMGCDRVNIWKFEPDFSTVVVAESTDSPHSLMGEQVWDECYQQYVTEVYREGYVRLVPDIYTTEMSDCHRELLIRLHTRAKVLLPLFCGEQLWGLLNASESQTARDWQVDEIDLLRNLANQLTIAIQQTSTHEQLRIELQERQQVEKQLHQSADRLKEAQRIARIGNWELDLQHNTLYWSAEVFRIFEIDPQRFSASYETFLELVHPEDRALVGEAYVQHLRDRQPYSLVHRLQMPDGRIKYVQEQCETTHSADGTPLISQGTVQDVTQQQEAEIRRDQAEASLRQVIEGTAALTGKAFFPALVHHISEALGVRYVSVSQATPEGFQVLAFFADGELCPPPFLPYDSVPCCLQSLQTGSCCHPADIQALYPDNALFTDLRVDSYLGVRLHNAAGDPIGNLCILHDAPLADPDWAQTLLSIFAARAGAELERLLTVQALQTLNTELEARVTQRTTELAEREALLQDFLDNASDLIQMVNVDTGHFEFVNRAWREVLGYTAAEVEQLTIFDILAPACLNRCQQVMEQMRAGTLLELKQVELTFVHRSGQLVLVEGSINCRSGFSADGRQQTLSTRAIFRDVTAKKVAEQELQQREARYRNLMESAPDAIMLANFQGQIMEANQKAETLLGYSLEELTTLHFSQLHPPEELPKVTAAFVEMAQRQRTQILGVSFQRRDGSTVPVDITASVIEVNGETLIHGIFRDISERKRYETALQESQQFLQTVLDTVPLTVFWKDRDSKYLGANRLFLHDAALSSVSELIGKSDFDMPWGATEAEAYRADDRTVMESGEAKLGIIEPLHQQDGTEIWLETNKLPLRNLAGEVIGVLGTYQEITERQKAAIALQLQLAAIEAAVNGIAILEDERFVYLNSSHVKMFGYENAEEVIGQSWRVLYSPKELEQFEREIFPILLTQKSWQGEVTATRKDGTTFPEQVSLTLSAGNLLICVCQDISERARLDAERKQAEAALRESERRYATLAQASPVAIFRFDIEMNCTYVNECWCDMTGRPIASAMGNHWLETMHPDDLERTQIIVQQWLQSGAGTLFQNEARILRDDGKIVWFYCQMLRETDINGQLVGYVGTLTDISDRKATELLIRQQANRETLIREITQRIRQSLDLQTIFDTACQEIRQVLQADRVGIFKFDPNTHWDDGEFVAESLVEGFVSAMAIRIQDHCFGDKYAPLYLQGRYAVMEDIFQLGDKCHTDVLAQIQVRANLVMPLLCGEQLWGLLCIHQCSGTRQWQESEVILTQQLATQLAIAIQQAKLFEQLQQELAERQQAQTQLTKRNQQLAVTNTELARATRLKDEFLANMSHELRTPLNAILGMTEGLQDEVFGIVNERQLNALNTVEKSASHLLTLINDILDVAKIESGKIELEPSHVAVEQLCSSSLAFIKQQAFKKRIQLQTQMPPHLPDLLVDEIRMRQVLLNLLTNAVKFTLEGGTVTLTVSLLPSEQNTSHPSYLRIAVTDTGIGIAPENITKLFKPFVQIDSALNRKYTGTGLGLALVKQIVELHGGQVGLTSELGVGSCFTIDLPYQLNVPPTNTSTSLPVATESDLSSTHSDILPAQSPLILLAEDNSANVATISAYLEAKGYRLLVANDGQEAIDLAVSRHPDVILMDVQMPSMDGLEAMKRIRQQESLRQIPIIALTALAMEGDQERCLAVGADRYVSKPVRLKQLDISIKELLAERSFR